MNRGNVDSDGNREVTIRGVYIANKRNVANITHIYIDNGGVFTNNKFPPPGFTLLPGVPAVNDAIYFGIDAGLTDSGPFTNLIFDINVPAVYPTTAAIVWEIWDGAWTTLVVSDNTSEDDSGVESWTKSGVGSVSWDIPANLLHTDTTTVNGVLGWWVRARVTNIGTGITPPTQRDKRIYSTVWPYIEIQEDEVGGDISAIISLDINNRGDDDGPGGSGPTLYGDRIIIGSRSVARGSIFTPYINLAQSQNPDNITIATAGGSTFTGSVTASPVGETLSGPAGPFTPAAEIATITIAHPLSSQYKGKYRAFLRHKITGGAGPIASFQLRYKTGVGGSTALSTVIVSPATAAHNHQLLELGIVDINILSEVPDEIEFSIYSEIGVGVGVELECLVLMPIDEWASDVKDLALTNDSRIEGNRSLIVDNIISPKRPIYYVADNSQAVATYQSIVNSDPKIIQENRTRLFFLIAWNDGNTYTSEFEQLYLVHMQGTQRYLSLRGDS